MRILVTLYDGILEEVATDQPDGVEVVTVDVDSNNPAEPVIIHRQWTDFIPDSKSLSYLALIDGYPDEDRLVCTMNGQRIEEPDDPA
jgi:hypothetical protein